MITRLCASATITVLALVTVMVGPGYRQASAVDVQPTTTIYLPNIVKMLGGADGWNTPIIVQNVGTARADVTFEFYRFSDGALSRTRTVTGLAPGTSVFDSPNHDEELSPNGQYSVVVKSYGSPVLEVVNEHQNEANPQRQEALSYDGLTTGSTKVFLPRVANANGWYCTVIAQNLGSGVAALTANFRSTDGLKTAQITRAIPALGSKFIDPRFEPALAAGTDYSVVMTSTQPIGVVVNCHNDDTSILQPRAYSYNGVLASNEITTFGAYAAKNVGGRSSRIFVQNSGTALAHPTMKLYQLGSWDFDTVQSPPAGLQPGAVWTYDLASSGLFDGEKTLAVVGGQFSLLVETIGPSSAMAYTGGTEWATRIYLPNVTKTLGGPSGWTTPFIVQSQGAFVASIRWYRMSDGVQVFSQTLALGLALQGTGYKIDPGFWAQLANNTQYAVVIESSTGGVGAVVLELNNRGGDSAMAYEAMTAAPPTAFGVSNCTPSASGAGASVRCRMYGFPPGTSSVTYTVQRSGGTSSQETLTDEPIAADGSWGLTTSSASAGVNTVTVTAGGVTR
ncbi:MAG: hypothetical protein E6J13_07430, partial [Chloroflexi bacterium]